MKIVRFMLNDTNAFKFEIPLVPQRHSERITPHRDKRGQRNNMQMHITMQHGKQNSSAIATIVF